MVNGLGYRCAVSHPPPDNTWVLWWAHDHAGEVPGLAHYGQGRWSVMKPVDGDMWHYLPCSPGKCEHGVADGDFCEECREDYKRAADRNGDEP